MLVLARTKVIRRIRVSVLARIGDKIGNGDRRIVGNFRQKIHIVVVGLSVRFSQKTIFVIVGSSVKIFQMIVGSSVKIIKKMIVGSSVNSNMNLKDDRRKSDHRIIGKFRKILKVPIRWCQRQVIAGKTRKLSSDRR